MGVCSLEKNKAGFSVASLKKPACPDVNQSADEIRPTGQLNRRITIPIFRSPSFSYCLSMNGAPRPWSALNPVLYSLNPFLIGLEYFLPLDLLFSVFFFFWAARMEERLYQALNGSSAVRVARTPAMEER